MRPYFSDAEINEMCEGLTQPAARVRHLRSLGLRVDRTPSGKPLAWRPETVFAANDAGAPKAANDGGVVASLSDWAARRRKKA